MSRLIYDNEQIINMYKELYNKLGRTPSQKEISDAYKKGEICSWQLIYKRFKGTSNLQKMLGYKTYQKRPSNYTKDEILSKLKRAYDYEGKRLGYAKTRKLINMREETAYKIVGVNSFDELWNVVENYNNKSK